MKLIFLDIDGVLNSHRYWHRRLPLYRGSSGGAPSFMSQYYKDVGFDGKYEIDPEAVKLMNELVTRTDAYLVLSSTWRLGSRGPDRLDGLEFTKNALALNGFEHNDRFLGKTPRLFRTPEGEDRVRGHEIQWWIDNWGKVLDREDLFVVPRDGKEIESFVILDDDSDMAHLRSRLVRTKTADGLNPWRCEEAEEMLQDEMCMGCMRVIRTDVCGCGGPPNDSEHGGSVDTYTHPFVPAGCDCLRTGGGRAWFAEYGPHGEKLAC